MHRLAAVLGHDGVAGENAEIFPLVVGDAPLAGRRLPDAGIKAAFGLLQVPGAELRIAGDDAVGLGRTEFRFDSR